MLTLAAGAVALVIVAGWAVLRWTTRGRDPTYLDDPSILLAAPPDGMTAATATIIDGGDAAVAFIAALLDLASRDEISFREEPVGGRPAVGIAIHGTPTDDPQVRLDRRRPVGEGEGWLLAQLRAYAIEGQAGLSSEDRGLEMAGAMSGLIGFLASSVAGGAPEAAPPGGRVDGMTYGMTSGPVQDSAAAMIAALERSGKPVPEHLRESLAQRQPMMGLIAEALKDPAAIAADPDAFAARVEATTGRQMTAEERASLVESVRRRAATMAAGASGTAAGGAAGHDYITAARALRFHAPFGFGTLIENYARRNGWIAGVSFLARWKWRGLAALEVVAGLALAGFDNTALGPVYGAGLGIAAGGVATWFIAPFMARRTQEGAVMKAQLAAYRRTLKATFATAATLDDVARSTGMTWLETPAQALVWGVALGLRPEIEELLRRTASGMAAGTVGSDAFLPRWIARIGDAVGAAYGTSRPASPGDDDYAAMFDGVARIGSVTTSS